MVDGATEVEMTVEERKGEVETGGWQTTCWGCGLRLLLPTFAPIFKCGWCGAITIHKPQAKPRGRWWSSWTIVRDRIFVSTVAILILSIVSGGVWSMFPVLFPKVSVWLYLHSAITILLAFNTLFNFCFSAFVQAGPPPPIEWGQYEVVGRGGLEGYRFCGLCHQPKPPQAHHCRTCRACVVDMDHHCPFIGNCVGRNNQRYFILFLIFTCLSSLYVLIMATYSGFQVWPPLVQLHSGPLPHTISMLTGREVVANILNALLLVGELVISVRAVALLYLLIASLALLIGVGLLLHQQLQLLYSGHTYLDTMYPGLNGTSIYVPGSKGWTNLRRVFGNGHPAVLDSSSNQCPI